MNRTVTIAGHGGKIVIEVFGYENAGASNYDDANWLTAKLSVEIGAFAGSFRVGLRTPELEALYREMDAAVSSLSGGFSFESTEGDLKLDGRFGRGGSVELAGVVRPAFELGAALHYCFESDQSYLSRAVEDLKLLIREFPVKKAG